MKKLISRFLVALSAFVPNNCSLAMDELTLNMLSNKELLKQKTERFEGFGWEKVLGNRDTIDLKKVRRIGTKKEVEAILDEYTEKFCSNILEECKNLDAQNQKDKVKLFKFKVFTEDEYVFEENLRIVNDIRKNGGQILTPRPTAYPLLTYLNRVLLRNDNCIVCRHLSAQLYKAFYDKGLLSCIGITGHPTYNHMVVVVPYMDGNKIKHWVSDPRALANILSDLCNVVMGMEVGFFHLKEEEGIKISTLKDLLSLNPSVEQIILNDINKNLNTPKLSELKALTDLMKMPLEDYLKWGHNKNLAILGIDPENEYVMFDSMGADEVAAYENDPTLNPYSVDKYLNSIKKIQKLGSKAKYKTRSYSVENKQKK